MSRIWWLSAIALTALAWVGSLTVYTRLPEKVPTHWNVAGKVDAYGDAPGPRF